MKKYLSHTIISLLIFIVSISFYSSKRENDKERMQNLYGENKEITGDYDKSLSVTCHNGIFVGLKNNNILSFKGIPYAKPPTGNLRWKSPIIAEDSNKVYQAYYFGKSPIQSEWPSEVGSYYPQDEDCLTLNIWLNTNNTSNDKTVMAFIHGGSYGWGGTSDPIYDGYNLIEKYSDIILVTIEYRVGLFGFINFSSVTGGEEYKSSGNLGLLDQICALQWIQKNIKQFGGNPERVTVFGESAGAGSVSLLPLIYGTDGLFKRIIAESGSINLSYSTDETKLLTEKLLDEADANNMGDLISLSNEKIKEINEDLNDYNNFPERDGVILPQDLNGVYKSGKGKNIDMLLGTNKDEVRYWINEMDYYTSLLSGKFIFEHGIPILFENNMKRLSDEDKKYVDDFMDLQNDKKVWKITEFYNEVLFRVPMNKQAEYHSDAGGNTYVYHWKYPGEDETIGACHAIELSYIFNNLQETIYTGNKINVELANEAQEMWVNFARYGDPSTSKHKWEKYDSKTRKTMILDENIHMEEDYKREQRLLIEPLLKYYFNGCYSNLSMNVPQFYKIVAQLVGTLLIIIGIIVIIIVLIVKRIKKRKKAKLYEEKDNNDNDGNDENKDNENKENNKNNDNDEKNINNDNKEIELKGEIN